MLFDVVFVAAAVAQSDAAVLDEKPSLSLPELIKGNGYET